MIRNLPSQNAFKNKYWNGGISPSPGLKPTFAFTVSECYTE